MSADGGVAAQMGVEFRVIRVGDAVVRTFGIVDLCVRESQRSRGLAGRLLADVTAHARSCGMAFIVLFADDDRLYTRNGWARVTNRCSWVRIDEHVTLGLARHEDTGAMMVKALGEQGSRHLPRRSSVSTPAAPVRRPAGGQMSVLRHHLRTALRRHPRTPASPSHKGGPQPRLADAGPQRGGAPLDAAGDPSGIRAWSAWRRAP